MSDSNNNFEDLKRLLKLKQHEVPPPGYFNRFSGDVVSRIRAGDAGGRAGVLDGIQTGSPFLASIFRLLEARPSIIGGFATSLCLVLLVGVVLADRPENASAGPDFASTSGISDAAPALASTVPLATADNSGISISTNPVSSLQPVASMFGSQNPLFQNASFNSGQ